MPPRSVVPPYDAERVYKEHPTPALVRWKNPQGAPIQNPDGTISTHKMAYGESDGQFVVYPTIFPEAGKLKEYPPGEAFRRAIKTGDIIPFNTEDEARWFSSGGYKVPR